MNDIRTFYGLRILTGINTHPGSGTIEDHSAEISMFSEILNHVDNDNPVMIEIGCYWAIWSLLFKQKYRNGKNILIDLGKRQLAIGEENFRLNDYDFLSYHGGFFLNESMTFHNRKYDIEYSDDENVELIKLLPKINMGGYVGRELDFNEIITNEAITRIDLLHMDIQGSELQLINNINVNTIHNLVIATHSATIHESITNILINKDFDIITNHDYGSIGGDGFLHAKNKNW